MGDARFNEIIYDEDVDVYVRRETYDSRSAREIRPMVRHLRVSTTDRVLDVGGHIGAFTRYCLKIRASVVTIEPEPGNLAVLERNISSYENRCTIMRVAVTDDSQRLSQDTTQLYLRGKTHTGLNTLHRAPTANTQWITVPVRVFRDVLTEVDPTVLKVDIEGGEWFLDWNELPIKIRAVHVEMHVRLPVTNGDHTYIDFERGRQNMRDLHQLLLTQGFTCTVKPRFNTIYGTHPVYHRS